MALLLRMFCTVRLSKILVAQRNPNVPEKPTIFNRILGARKAIQAKGWSDKHAEAEFRRINKFILAITAALCKQNE
jgi:hypothetical protein